MRYTILIVFFLLVQIGHLKSVIEECSHALELNPRYVKALTRRLRAYESVGRKKDALLGMSDLCK